MSKILPSIPSFTGVNYYVPSLNYSADVSEMGDVRVEIDALIAANASGILAAQSIAAAGSTTVFAAAYNDNVMGRYGRNVTVIASGAATSLVTVRGFDYLGQPVAEQLTLNGATAVQGVKTFKRITQIDWGLTAAVTINVGWGDRLGIPYRAINPVLYAERVSAAVPTAGTLVAGLALNGTGSLTSADPRGYYQPHASVVPNGVRTYDFQYFADVDSLHGQRHFYA